MSAILVRSARTHAKGAVALFLIRGPVTKAAAETMMEFTHFAKNFSVTVLLIKSEPSLPQIGSICVMKKSFQSISHSSLSCPQPAIG